MRSLVLPSGAAMPAFGLGTWGMGERSTRRAAEADALRAGLDAGARLIDTAEMYGDGGAERVVGDALDSPERRDRAFIVSKVYPHNASADGVVAACERSLQRLRCERIDLYLLHWRGGEPLAATRRGFETLLRDGKIADYGVSNFDRGDLDDASAAGMDALACNQVLYSLARREAEATVLPWCRQRGVAVTAYCPLDQGGAMLEHPTLAAVARRLDATPAQTALAWLLAQPGVAVIPKSARPQRVRENLASLRLRLDRRDIDQLDVAFAAPPPDARLGMV